MVPPAKEIRHLAPNGLWWPGRDKSISPVKVSLLISLLPPKWFDLVVKTHRDNRENFPNSFLATLKRLSSLFLSVMKNEFFFSCEDDNEMILFTHVMSEWDEFLFSSTWVMSMNHESKWDECFNVQDDDEFFNWWLIKWWVWEYDNEWWAIDERVANEAKNGDECHEWCSLEVRMETTVVMSDECPVMVMSSCVMECD